MTNLNKYKSILTCLRVTQSMAVSVFPIFLLLSTVPLYSALKYQKPSDFESTSIPLSITESPMEGNNNGFISGLIASFSMIILSELGDKTFLFAAIMAMKNPRMTVFLGATTALGLMTILSALFGGIVTSFLSPFYTRVISAFMFSSFGIKMLYEGMSHIDEDSKTDNDDIEILSDDQTKSRFMKTISWLSPVFLQSFTMTFLEEWGDRSQLATVLLAARENIWGICFGGILGHALCTILAVVGGRMLAKKISVKTVTTVGGLLFLGFALVSLVP